MLEEACKVVVTDRIVRLLAGEMRFEREASQAIQIQCFKLRLRQALRDPKEDALCIRPSQASTELGTST